MTLYGVKSYYMIIKFIISQANEITPAKECMTRAVRSKLKVVRPLIKIDFHICIEFYSIDKLQLNK